MHLIYRSRKNSLKMSVSDYPLNIPSSTETFSNLTFVTKSTTEVITFEWYIKLSMALSIIIFIVGIVGNILAFIVMRRRPFLASSACIYLPCMALFDTIFLVSGLIHEWTSWYQIDFVVWLCRVYRFVNYSSGDISIWIMVAFTFDRFVAVCFPFKKKAFCEPKKSVITVIVVCILGAVKNFHLFWTRGQEKNKMCGKVEKYIFFEKRVRPWIALALVSILPFICIVIFNISIVHHLLKSARSRPKAYAGRISSAVRPSISHSGTTNLSKSDTSSHTKTYSQNNNKAFYQTTAMCLSVSFAFLICVFPTIFLQLGKPYWKKQAWYAPTKNLNVMLVFVNHSINFYLYCLTGVKFRAELVALFKKSPRSYSIFSGLNKFTHHGPSVLMSDVKSSSETVDKVHANPAIALAILSNP